MKRVALVLGARHNFWLDQRVQRTARALAAGGYDVIAYTPAETEEQERPMEGVTPCYVNAIFGRAGWARGMLLDYLLYNLPLALDMRKRRVDICHCNDFDTLPSGVLLKMLTLGKVRVVYDSHEDYPRFVEEGHGRLLARTISVGERVLVRVFVDRVLAVTEALSRRFEGYGIKSETIFNCQELAAIPGSIEDTAVARNGDDFVVAYQGKATRIRGYEQMIEAASILVSENRTPNTRFVIIGDSEPPSYGDDIQKLVSEKGLEKRFVFTGYVPYNEMMGILRSADAGVILFQPTPNNVAGLPNKLFENLAAGIPTIASDFPEMARIVSGEECGLLVDPTQPGQIADAIEYLYNNREVAARMGENALRAAQSKYNFAQQAEKLLSVYRDIT